MGRTLRGLRADHDYNLKQAAKLLNVSVDTLRNWENAVTFPNVLQIKRIEQVYGCEYRDIIFCPNSSV